MADYLLVFAIVLGVNLMPAFGPPTWAVLVYYRLASELAPVPLVIVGAIAAVTGRVTLALAFRLLQDKVPSKQRDNLEAAGKLLSGSKKRSIAGLAIFAFSPVPSAQLFEAAGVMKVKLLPLTSVFFAGRIVSYSLYVAGASAAKQTDLGELVMDSFTSPWGIALQIVMLAGIYGLTRIDFVKLAKKHT